VPKEKIPRKVKRERKLLRLAQINSAQNGTKITNKTTGREFPLPNIAKVHVTAERNANLCEFGFESKRKKDTKAIPSIGTKAASKPMVPGDEYSTIPKFIGKTQGSKLKTI